MDQDNKQFFPHVTRSYTGIKNACELLKEWGIESADVYYVTRSYLTRHGAGPMPFEDQNLFYVDKTNMPNEYQGTLRFAPLNIDLLKSAISNDVKNANGIHLVTNAVITCVNQVEDTLRYVYKGIIRTTNNFTDVYKLLNVDNVYISDGPTAEDLTKL